MTFPIVYLNQAFDGVMAVVTKKLRAGTGTQDFLEPGMGPPAGALVVMTGAPTDGVPSAGLLISVGATDGTNQRVAATTSLDGQANVVGERHSANNAVLLDNNGNPPVIRASASLVQDGLQLNVTVNSDAEFIVTAYLFGGDVVDFQVGEVPATVIGAGNAITGVGFEPSALIAFGASQAFNDTPATTMGIHIGWGANESPIGQAAFAQIDVHTSASGDPRSGVLNGYCYFNVNGTAVGSRVAVASFDADGFTYDVDNLDLSTPFSYIALRTTSGNAHAEVLDLPTATGNEAWTGFGFEAKAALMAPTMIATAGAVQTNASAGAAGLAGVTASGQHCHAWAVEDAAPNTNTQSLANDTAIHLTDHAGVDAFIASVVSFDADGMTLEFDDADGTVRKMPVLALA